MTSFESYSGADESSCVARLPQSTSYSHALDPTTVMSVCAYGVEEDADFTFF